MCCSLFMCLHAVLQCTHYGVPNSQDAKEAAPPASAAAAAGSAAGAPQRVVVSDAVVESTQQALHWLRERRMLTFEGGKWSPRQLGLATHASGLLPEEAVIVREARHTLVLG